MQYSFFFNGPADLQEMETSIREILCDGQFEVNHMNSHRIQVCTNCFLLYLDSDANFTRFVSEDYAMPFQFLGWFESYYSEDGSTTESMMRVIGSLIARYDCDCILCSNGDNIFLKKHAGGPIVVDMTKWEHMELFPFRCLGLPYQVGYIERK